MTNFRSAVSLTCCCATYSVFSWLSCWHWWEHLLYYVYIYIQCYFAKGRVTFKLIAVVLVSWKLLMIECYTAVWRFDVFGARVEGLHISMELRRLWRGSSDCVLLSFRRKDRNFYAHLICMVWLLIYVFQCICVCVCVCCDVCIYAFGLIGCISSFSYS